MSSIDRLRPLLALAAVLALAGGCAHKPPASAMTSNGRDTKALTPLEQYPIRAVERPEQVALAVHPQGALSAAQDAALESFAQTWREAGGVAPVVVEAPSTGGPDAQLSAQATTGRLVALGIAPSAIRITPYEPGPAPGAPVIARFDHLAAAAPDCSKGWDNLVATNDNTVSTHFGCANARNFAVMLADPHDLKAPRAMTPSDAGRRAMVLDNYRKGSVTASAKDDQANGAVSQTVR